MGPARICRCSLHKDAPLIHEDQLVAQPGELIYIMAGETKEIMWVSIFEVEKFAWSERNICQDL